MPGEPSEIDIPGPDDAAGIKWLVTGRRGDCSVEGYLTAPRNYGVQKARVDAGLRLWSGELTTGVYRLGEAA